MSDKKRGGKVVTSILIGGALGSLAAWVFGGKKNKDGSKKRGFFARLFGR